LFASALASWSTLALAENMPLADPQNEAQVARGQAVYTEHCASCHGADLKGHPDWKQRLPSGRMPPPPHDATGHTWHHPDEILFGMIQRGVAAYAWKGYESDMPAFGSILSDDDIWAVLAYLKSTWPEEVRASQSQRTEQARRQAASRQTPAAKKP
jgi:mono/diheme cytochrome c family protein